AVPAALSVVGEDGSDSITIGRDAANPRLVNIKLDTTTSTTQSFPIGLIPRISVSGGKGDDTLRIDSTAGVVPIPIVYDGGMAGNDALLFQGAVDQGTKTVTGTVATVMIRTGANVQTIETLDVEQVDTPPNLVNALNSLRQGLSDVNEMTMDLSGSNLFGQ